MRARGGTFTSTSDSDTDQSTDYDLDSENSILDVGVTDDTNPSPFQPDLGVHLQNHDRYSSLLDLSYMYTHMY